MFGCEGEDGKRAGQCGEYFNKKGVAFCGAGFEGGFEEEGLKHNKDKTLVSVSIFVRFLYWVLAG